MIIFYSPDLDTSGILPEGESAHCIRVLRKNVGDIIQVVDGKGNRYRCRIVKADSRKTELVILSKEIEPDQYTYNITLIVAPTKNIERMEWMVEKCIEIGVGKIIFLKCGHSERKSINLERMQKIAISAMKQSLKSKLPEISYQPEFNKFIKNIKEDKSLKFMGYCSDDFKRTDFVKILEVSTDTMVLIGPEGDFTPQEVSEAINTGFIPVTFGNERLRTETAALYAVTAIHVKNTLMN